MNGELRIYKDADFKRLRRIIGVSTGNLCYNMACPELNDVVSSARWTGLPTTASVFSDGQVKMAFYTDSQCMGNAVAVSANVGEIRNFAELGMDNVTTSFAVLEASMAITNGVANVCEW